MMLGKQFYKWGITEHMETEAAVLLIDAINKAIAEVKEPDLRRAIEALGDKIITNLKITIFAAREPL